MKLKQTIGQEYSNYLDSMGLNPVTSNKYRAYLNDFLNLFDYQITQKFLDNYLSLPKKNDPNHRCMIQHLMNLLKRDDTLTTEEQLEVSRLVMLKIRGRKIKKEKATLTKEQIEKIANDSNLGDSFKTSIFKLMLLFQYNMALRVSELCSLKFSILKNAEKVGEYRKIHLPPEITKTKQGAPVYLPLKIMTQYSGYLESINHLPKFNQLIYEITQDKKTIWFDFSSSWYAGKFKKECMRILGVNRSSHCLRHSKATHLLQSGIPFPEVQTFMRHADPSSTSVYLHQLNESLEGSLSNIKKQEKEEISASEHNEIKA